MQETLKRSRVSADCYDLLRIYPTDNVFLKCQESHRNNMKGRKEGLQTIREAVRVTNYQGV